MKRERLKVIYKNMDSQANLLDAQEAVKNTIRSSEKALEHIDKSLEYSRVANKLISKEAA